MSLLTINKLKKRYVNRDALNGIDLVVERGRIIGLLGPNGSGKTTLLKCIAGLLQPDSGEILYPGGAARGIESKKTISLLPDAMRFPGWMTIGDALQIWRETYPDYNPEKSQQLMALLGLEPKEKIKRLSKGMQERVSLLLAFSRKTSVYLLDEPLGGIDPVGKQKILESILGMELDDAAILLSTHLVKDVETVFDSFFLISEGKIVFAGDCETIRAESGKTAEQVYLEVFS